MKTYNFPIVITQDEDGIYIAKVPSLLGCHTQAKTLADLYVRIEEAIALCLEVEKMKRHNIYQERFIGMQQIQVSI
ncbi:MAG: hypothetical protein UR28_C0001G0063 [Candidatus Peregrinibacteria bacterium GW2011_GWF2_33_10]|nr:MAG: hypothetical protein UR28_C0001G0063 [Candidatus Peregrinibacteria bacterium GW2011_GWF2_33_10]OGJ44809.1 MAG: hypothetical protein A2263_06250 [Candidatus Peregrinibacteria bacterium RIFOXYA2_FULL_33_21]OGJ47392.1 MAG: hypothetical protein A2272_02650 [Candidatus Peregrinibacteria bacterium RIFOXYA12_FULL_33_12]OGJ50495.1 MAG: hypothetical protein A2307_02875 [Candidatus Peregrinibacteria bacterium RIFOXYB2_FULL_33_20]